MQLNPTRVARNASAAVVAGIAAWSSYRHMVEVALAVGESPEVAYALPLSVDGMLVVASVAMVDDRRAGRMVRWSARLAFAVGVFASLAANVAAAQPTTGARIVAAWPALALLLTVELLSRSGKVRAGASAPVAGARQAPTAEPATVRVPEPRTATAPPATMATAAVGMSVRGAGIAPSTDAPPSTGAASANGGAPTNGGVAAGGAAIDWPALRGVTDTGPSGFNLGRPSGAPRGRGRSGGGSAARRSSTPRARRPVAETLALAAAIEAAQPEATHDDIAAQLGISTKRLREVLASAA